MPGRVLTVAACAVILIVPLAQRQARAQVEPNIELPLSVCVPSATGFIPRRDELRAWVKKAIGDPENGKLFAKLRTVASRRSSPPAWTSRAEPWSDTADYTVHFAVGKVSDHKLAVPALKEAERRAKAALTVLAQGGRPFVIDWYMDDDGVTFALAGAIEQAQEAVAKPEPPAPAPVPAETPAVETPAEETPADQRPSEASPIP